MQRFFSCLVCATLVFLAVSSCGPKSSPTATPLPPTRAPAPLLQLASNAFAPGESIPKTYTCDAENVSPALQWSDPPPGTQSFALIFDDPTAGGWVHWVVYNLPAHTRSLPEDVAPDAQLPGNARQGRNSWNKVGYGGPCPPSGTHRYVFKLYALDRTLDLPADAQKLQVLEAMQGHVLAQAELIGLYKRQ